MIINVKQYLHLSLLSLVRGGDYFEGTVMIDGLAHTLSCACDKPLTTQMSGGLNIPLISPSVCESVDRTSVISEKVLKTDVGLTAEDISAYYGQPRQIVMSHLEYEEFKCADARWTTELAFTMGGDLGEFLIIANVINGLSTTVLQDEEIGQAMLSWLQSNRALTYCTDREGVAGLISQIGRSLDLNSPPDGLSDAILSSLSQNAELHGDAFWRCLVGSPADYKISKSLLRSVLTAFFKIHWAKNRLVSTGTKIHSSEHKPQAIIRNTESELLLSVAHPPHQNQIVINFPREYHQLS